MNQLTITCSGNTVTVSDRTRTRQSVCAGPGSAKCLASRMRNDPVFATRWLRTYEPVQPLALPADVARRVAMLPATGNSKGMHQRTGGLIDDEK